MARLNPKQAKRAIRYVLNKNFTFADLSPKFKNVDSSTGNIFCPFHENHHSPAAKMYWDDDREIWIIHCFGQCHRNFTAFDYVDLILCNKYGRYKSPLDFLRVNMQTEDLYVQLENVADKLVVDEVNYSNAKEDYINSVAEEYENTEDYIEMLYTA